MPPLDEQAPQPLPLPRVKQTDRPLSPHLSIYKPQLTSLMSIIHRVTGFCLAGGIALLVSWLISIAMGPEAYATYAKILSHPIAVLFIAAWSWGLFYHMCCGVRHLLWDVGACLTLPAIYKSGYIAAAVSALATLGLWAFIFLNGVISWP